MNQFTKVSDTLYRGPRPDLTNQMILGQLEQLNIKTVINLEVGFFEFLHGEADQEKRLCHNYDLTYAHLPLSDITPPSGKAINLVMAWIKNASKAGNVLVHCLHGKSRTGMICAGYRVKEQAWPVDKAIDEMLAMGFEVFPYKYLGWIGALREDLSS